MLEILYNAEKSFINLIDRSGAQPRAVTQTSMTPVNTARMPNNAAIFVDNVAFDKMCMDYVRQKGESKLIEAAERRTGKPDAIFAAANSALLGSIFEGRSLNEPKLLDECVALAEKLYDKIDAKKY